MQTIVCPIALAGSIVLTGLSSVFADVVDFPNADSSGDLSSAAAWGGTLPATTDTIELNKSYGQTLTFGQSCTFDTLLFKGNSTANTVEITDPEVVVKLSGTENAEPGIRTVTKTTSAALTLKGGTYDLNGKGVLTASAATDSGNNSNSGCSLTLDGVVVSNAASISVVNARDAGSCKLVLTNGTHVYAKTATRFMNSYSITRAATGIVAGGSTLTITDGSFYPFYSYMTGGLLLVTGEGSVVSNVSANSDYLFYNNPKQCTIRVENGGEFNARNPVIGYSAGVNNAIEVLSGGLVRFHGSDYSFPYSPSATGMALKIFENGTFLSPNTMTLQQSDNQILVSNGTFNATLQISGTRNAVRVSGPKARYIPNLSRIFSANAKNCLLEFSDKATWSSTYSYLTATGAEGNTFSVVRDAMVSFGAFNGFSYNANSLSGYTVRIANGGKIECKAPTGHADWNYYLITGYDNATVISNGTLDVEGDMRLGEASSNVAAEKGETNTRNSLVFQGQAPLLKVGGDARLSRGTCIRFEVPKGGYSDKAVVWTARQLYAQEGDSMRLEMTGLDEDYVKGLESSFDVTLIKTTGYSVNNVSGSLGTQVAELAKTMPPRVRLYISAEGRELHLAAKPYRGMMLLVR